MECWRISSFAFFLLYGGEEFLVILGETDAVEACEAAEILRKTVEAKVGVTISLGVTICKTLPTSPGLQSSFLWRGP